MKRIAAKWVVPFGAFAVCGLGFLLFPPTNARGAGRVPKREPFVETAKFRFTAHLLPRMVPDAAHVAAAVTVADRATGASRDELLPDGSSVQRGIALSPDGRFVYTVHGIGRYKLPATQLERGWQCSSALSVFDARTGAYLNTVSLDDETRGAANPWSVAVTPDGRRILVTHAGTGELSVIDRAAFHKRFSERMADPDLVADFSFLRGVRERVDLKGDGPREILRVDDRSATIDLHFSDFTAEVRFDEDNRVVHAPKARATAWDSARRGEFLFNDAKACFQQWQSCASCHPDGGKDGLKWDLRGDGVGNPRNTISPADGVHDRMACVAGSYEEDLFAEMPEGGARNLFDFVSTLPRSGDGRACAK